MSAPAAHPPQALGPLPALDPASRALLEGLAGLHAVVVATDEHGRVVFQRDPGALLGAPAPTSFASAPTDAPAAAQALVRAFAADAEDDTRTGRFAVRTFATQGEDAPSLRVALLDTGATEALRQKNEELETCLRSVSHDLRSPLVSVLGFTRLMRDEFGEPIGRTGRHFLDRIEQAGRNMERLLADLLALTRLEDAPNLPVHVSPVAVLEQLAAEQKLALDEAGIELAIPREAPAVVCDRTRLYQLFSNLVGNAIRHVPGDGTGRIEVRVAATDDGWLLDVEDNGPGIAPEDRERIFDAFRTARHARTSPGGRTPTQVRTSPEGRVPRPSGLGLAIVRKIVEAQGGRVRVEDAPGGGARFRVWLPRPDTGETDPAATA